MIHWTQFSLFRITFSVNYKETQNLYSSPRPPETDQAWTPPETGTIKVNYDASIKSSQDIASVGVVARDNEGRIIAWQRKSFPFITSVEAVEALAARTAVILAYELDLSSVIFEGVCKNVVTQLKATTSTLSFVGNIINKTKSLSFYFHFTSFCYVRTSNC